MAFINSKQALTRIANAVEKATRRVVETGDELDYTVIRYSNMEGDSIDNGKGRVTLEILSEDGEQLAGAIIQEVITAIAPWLTTYNNDMYFVFDVATFPGADRIITAPAMYIVISEH